LLSLERDFKQGEGSLQAFDPVWRPLSSILMARTVAWTQRTSSRIIVIAKDIHFILPEIGHDD